MSQLFVASKISGHGRVGSTLRGMSFVKDSCGDLQIDAPHNHNFARFYYIANLTVTKTCVQGEG